MRIRNVFSKHISQIREGGIIVMYRKIKVLFRCVFQLPQYIIALPIVILMRLMSQWYLIRLGSLISSRIGHFSANTEIYLCEREEGINVPNRPHLDIFFFGHKPLCNKQLAKMWKRTLRIWPSWIVAPVNRVNEILPGGANHQVGRNTQSDRDVHNLLDKYPAHLKFTKEEKNKGLFNINSMGIPSGTPFVCFIVRDKEYLENHMSNNDWSYHNYRDSSIENFVLAAEALVDRGYYVIRMGAVVGKAFPTDNPKIIDYAFNGMRTDFMDIYLGAKCSFCVSTGTGWDGVPGFLFRKPVVFTNFIPIGYLPTYSRNFIFIIKKHVDINTNLELSLSQIFSRGVGFCLLSSEYENQNIKLVENTPEEICDVVLEMEDRISGKFIIDHIYQELQSKFFKLFPINATDRRRGVRLHGKISASFGAKYLLNNQNWLS
jgi:putative glycosyltransferase (TIGR04372 family)